MNTKDTARQLWPATAAEIDASEALHNSTTRALLRAAYGLTHRMHVAQNAADASRRAGYARSSAELRELADELRAQRDLIDAEIERRCAR